VKKALAILLMLVSLAILLTAMNQSFINRVKNDKYFVHLKPDAKKNSVFYNNMFLLTDRWQYGDLYGLCYLHQYKVKLEPFKKYDQSSQSKITNRILYIIGDSYLADKILNNAFNGFDNVIFLDRRFPFGPIRLDSTKQNYLIMEFAERNLVKYDLWKTDEIKWSKTDITAKANFKTEAHYIEPVQQTSLPGRFNKVIFNKDLSRNIELLIFDHKVFTTIKEWKAAFNYYLLGRLPKEIAVSSDKTRLFLNETVDTTYLQSSFRFKSNQEVNKIANNLKAAKIYYQSVGFKKVFLAIIPNTVSVCDDNRMAYNHLLQRVENASSLPVISTFSNFKTSKQNLFYNSDAHWNPHGFDLWVRATNQLLQTNIKQNLPANQKRPQ
jgi:hypothetical protein